MQSIEQIWQQIHALPHKYIFYTRKEIRYLPKILNDNERIVALTSGFMGKQTWLVVCTSQRILYLNRGMFFGLRQVQMNLDRIQTIDSDFGIAFGSIRTWDGAASMTVSLVLKSSVAPFVKAVQDAMDRYKRYMVHELAKAASNANAPKPSQGSATSPHLITELERLAKLKTDGLLSEIEFTAAKAKLLGDNA